LETSDKKDLFNGLIITSFSWAIVGPLTMRYFADHGATVIRIENSMRPCTLRISTPYKDGKPGLDRSGYYNHYGANILSMALNMEHLQSKDIVKKLVGISDVVMENFTPGVIEKWGLDYEKLKQIKSNIIMLRQSGFGNKGPHAHQPAFGMILGAMAGIPNFIGSPDGAPLPIGVSAYTDCISPRFATAALIAALDHRNKTGEGQLIDISQFETALYFVMPALLDYAANGREPVRKGNTSDNEAPHGVYPCRGEDRWCTIAVANDGQWENLCRIMEQPDLIDDARFQTLLARKKNEEELNKIVSSWTSSRDPEEVMQFLQSKGIPAGIVENAADIYNDPQLRERGMFWPMEHPEMGMFTHLGQSFEMSKTPGKAYRPSPLVGEHTGYVCSELLGIKDEEFAEMMGSGLFE
jgi:benzylsuccinate CoA-transferase BbsF subunit